MISQPVALISGSRAQIATKVQSPREPMDGASTQCNALYNAAVQRAATSISPCTAALESRGLQHCKPAPSPALMDYCVPGIKAGARRGSSKTSVLEGKSNAGQEMNVLLRRVVEGRLDMLMNSRHCAHLRPTSVFIREPGMQFRPSLLSPNLPI